ncbi:hypothetical protein ATE84_3646 [Aquimarina sp. MAR_2010_214]|uniref:hypothetical protein n=1 Tax=Aquimarina sp. MAR_2010_214 TaxID=1250026 RepID=UPI000C700F68|nr:hypothetical protein [Aquimarina sp. MAR_2010_214]PKV51558.1 hypothetical protein ATE84_3646 [Aquimarina sp. MAR_2010_214]
MNKRTLITIISIGLVLFSCKENKQNEVKDKPLQVEKTETKKNKMETLGIEQKLSELISKKISNKDFVTEFLKSEAFVCLPKGQVNKATGMIQENPTLFTLTYPEYVSICFYTSESNAEKTFKQFPNFEEVAKINVADFLNTLKGNKFGIVINPYCDLHKIYSLEESIEIQKEIANVLQQ